MTDEPENAPLYYASGIGIWQRPVRSATGFAMGFRICTLDRGMPDEAAHLVADLMNAGHEALKAKEAKPS